MKLWQKAAVILGVGIFPVTLLLLSEGMPAGLSRLLQPAPVVKTPATASLEASIEAKVQELSSVDVRILAARGELLRFEDQKRAMLEDLEALRIKIGELIAKAHQGGEVRAQAP